MTQKTQAQIIVVGGGPAGLMAAGAAGAAGAQVLLLEKMPRLGRKLLITGKGRCNLTNTAALPDFIAQYPQNGRFLYGAFSLFDNQALRDFFAALGLPTKVERGGRVFPVSDRSVDVLQTLVRYAKTHGVQIKTNEPVQTIRFLETGPGKRKILGVTTRQREYAAKAVILATGGLSYPATGSTGDGFRWAKHLGHTVVAPEPGLVPLEVQENWVREVQGLALKNVRVTAWDQPTDPGEAHCLGSEFGEMLFTHFGVSGPIILSISRSLASYFTHDKESKKKIQLSINLKPALAWEQLDKRLQRDFTTYARKQFKNALGDLLPGGLIPVFIDLSRIPGEKYVHQLTRQERHRLVDLFKDLRLTVTNTRPLAEAIVTAGGVSVKEINPRTMGSRCTKGLYFAGELLDVDGYTGGFNLQAAFSTGYVAGIAAAQA